MPIYAEARIGELLPSAEEAERGTSTNGERYRRPEGMTNKRARAARTIKDHPEIVAKIKAQAREKLAVSKADAARIMHGANAPCRTWASYCQEVGITKSTANRWLAGMIRYSRG